MSPWLLGLWLVFALLGGWALGFLAGYYAGFRKGQRWEWRERRDHGPAENRS